MDKLPFGDKCLYCVLSCAPFVLVLIAIAGTVSYTGCQSVGSFCYKFVSVSGQYLCQLSMGGTIAIKKCFSA
jgi:hypothetical protein